MAPPLLQGQRPAGQPDQDPVAAQPRPPGGGEAGAGPGAAGQGDPAPPLPHPDQDGLLVGAGGELDIGPLPQGGVPLQQGAQPLQIHRPGVGAEDHPVRIARPGGDEGEGLAPRLHLQRGQQPDFPHVRRGPPHPALPQPQLQGPGSGVGVHGQAGPVRQAPVVHILAQTAQAVAAHGPPGAVGVVHLHGEVPRPAGLHTDQPVGPHPEVPVRHPPGQAGQVLRHRLHAVYINIVVAQSLQFRKAHRPVPFPGPRPFGISLCASPAGHVRGPEAALWVFPTIFSQGGGRLAGIFLAIAGRIGYDERD